MHISLTPSLEEYTNTPARRSNNASEVIREALRLMLQRD
jgi:Arc/MetJ-type ribon-helix-helix transcriptional regulator